MASMVNTSGFDSSSVSSRDIEEALVRSAQNGCRASFTNLVRMHSERLYKFVYGRTHNSCDAEDICQETFVKAYEKLSTYNFKSKFSTWLFTIAVRKTIDAYRKKKDSIRISEIRDVADGSAGPQAKMMAKERRDRIWEIARGLSGKQFEAMELRYSAGMDISEISRAMDISRIHVKVLLYRARCKMARLLREAGFELDYMAVRELSGRESSGVL